MRLTALLLPLLAAAPCMALAQDVAEDPYIWLEAQASPEALAWVEAHNALTAGRLEADPRYAGLHADALAILTSEDRIPMVSFRGEHLYNFWQDGEHLRGIWRRTTLASYAGAAPVWETVLDVDALGAAEGKSWVYKGVTCLPPERTRCLVSLSDGGADAVEAREFDLSRPGFVEGGFMLPMSQQDAAWEDADQLLVATDWAGNGADLTSSGYPYIVKRVTRGQPLAEAREIFRGGKDDVGTFPSVMVDGEGNKLSLLAQATDFFHSKYYVLAGEAVHALALPEKSSIQGLVADRLIVSIEEDWQVGGTLFAAGSVVALARAAVLADPAHPAPSLVWQPGPREALESVATTRDRLVLTTLDNVRGRITAFAPEAAGGWSHQVLPLPDNLALSVASADDASDRVLVVAEGFLTPDRLYLLDAAAPAAEPIVLKDLAPQFAAPGHVVEQYEAVSSDGTKIPYFVVRPKDAPLDGSTPTLMTAYGGFQVSETPNYSGVIGRLWLERGGAFVLANIRGGGEFGPAWHQAGLGVKRQIIYDDFVAVSRDLATRGLTSAEHLGIFGGSNGGLLMGVAMVQHPELYGAIAIQIPLLDMIRISKIARGASWQGEYGDVNADPEVRAFWEKTSPYQNLDRAAKYPEPYIFTTTRDDRTGPQHARKFAARMEEYGLPFLYFENTEGGHGAGADARQSAVMYAQMITYFSEKLGLD